VDNMILVLVCLILDHVRYPWVDVIIVDRLWVLFFWI